jgi:hypothetical protein
MTTTVYLDESGDLGFDFAKAKTSRYFVVAALVCSDLKPVAKAVAKVLASFSKAEARRHRGALHAFREKDVTVRRALRELSGLQITCVALAVDKRALAVGARRDPHALSNSLVELLLTRAIFAAGVAEGGRVGLVASRRETKASLNERFVSHLSETVASRLRISLGVTLTRAEADKGLQAADIVSWSAFQRYGHGNPTYIEMIQDRMFEDRPWDE